MRALELYRHPELLRFGRHARQPIAERIGPELVHNVEWVHSVPLRLAHPIAIAVEDRRVNEYVAEWHLPKLFSPVSTIRATQSVMMSRLVMRTLVG